MAELLKCFSPQHHRAECECAVRSLADGGANAELAALRAENARLKEWKESVSSAIKNIPEFHTGAWAGDKEGWGFHFEVVNWLIREREKLYKALAPFEWLWVHEIEPRIRRAELPPDSRDGSRFHLWGQAVTLCIANVRQAAEARMGK